MTDFDHTQLGDQTGQEIPAVVVDKRGVLMRERESYERVIEGLKMAADGAHHLVKNKQDGNWRQMSAVFDKLRAQIAKLGGLSSEAQDAVPTEPLDGSKTMGLHASFERVYNGLNMATKGSRQIATCHRGDLRWSKYAIIIETLRDKCSLLVRMNTQRRSGIVIPTGMM